LYVLGKHWLVEMEGCDPKILTDLKKIRDAMVVASQKANTTMVAKKFHRFRPIGVSGVVVIAESHLGIHTWPEYEYAAIDFFACGNQTKLQKAVDYLAKILGAKKVSIRPFKRGPSKKPT
jgi:S-adenosylmethionine decarboxylase